MRKMISGKQQEAIKKLSENIVINDDGTVVEIGGNVAVESIEQIGHIVDKPSMNTIDTEYVLSNPITGTPDIYTGATNFVKIGTWTEVSESAPFRPTNIGDVKIGNGVLGLNNVILYKDIDGKSYQALISSGANLLFNGGTVVESYSNYVKAGGELVPTFEPFFTEEQYQEILDLIA